MCLGGSGGDLGYASRNSLEVFGAVGKLIGRCLRNCWMENIDNQSAANLRNNVPGRKKSPPGFLATTHYHGVGEVPG